ncbi:Protein disulfide isomerase pTAC5, chloroplastic [Linum grandiflorum]
MMLLSRMSSSSSFLNPIPLNPPRNNLPRFHLLQLSKSSISLSKSHVFYASSSSSSSNSNSSSSGSDRDALLWLREEQRWLREEQRWLREEQRWFRERDSLLTEIQSLKLRIQALEDRISVSGTDGLHDPGANVGPLLQVLKETSLIPESGSSANPIVLEETKEEEEEETAESAPPALIVDVEREEKVRKALKMGNEGDEFCGCILSLLQEALSELGFYSGEEDMEYSWFSSGTERAVKTWQATLSVPEDGIMSTELLERLYKSTRTDAVTPTDKKRDEDGNGAAVPSVTEISDMQKKVVKEEGGREAGMSKHRVFLLGENRWEEPSRLVGKSKEGNVNMVRKVTKCLTCRDEGRLMCTECDGTGEPNIEPQFMEWIGEDTKCAYCEGQGFTICDACQGKTIA